MSITRSSPVQVAAYSTTFSQAPKLVSTSWSKISVGPSHVLAIRSNNTLYAWGFNNVGQLGDGTTISRSSPVQIGNPSIYTWTDIVAGLNFSVGLRGDNLLFTWGLNTNGQLGDLNAGTSNRSSPIQVGTSSWNAVSAGGSHVVAIRSDKSLWGWGLNSLGQLGTNDLLTRSSPVQVSSSSWSIVSAGNTHTTAITTDGKLYTWGDNTVGTLGYTIPPQTYYSWTSVSGNADYTVAIRNDGLLFAWGTNNFGQLGDFTTINRSSPVQIGSNSWSVVTANAPTGGGPVLAIRSDGTLWGWGYNATGVLGINDVANRSSPVQVGTGSWTKVAASKSHTLAIKSDGTLYTWGLGSSGQLGLGINSRSSPVQIGTTGTINSIYFTGGSSNDKLTLASSAAFNLSSGTWTIEFWMYTFSLPGAGNNCRILMFGTNAQSNSFAVSFASDGSIGAGVAFTGTGIASTSGTIVINTWYHFAVVSNSGSANVYVNGVLKAGPITITQPTSGNIGLNIGYDTVATVNYQYTGYLSNIRIIKGQSLFTGAFTPSTSPLTTTTVGHTGSGAVASISGTVSLLTAQSTTIIDNSSNNFTITLTGSPVVTPTVVPFSGQVLTNISYIQVSAGDTSSYAIKNDNQLYTWGAGTDGRLGHSTTINRSSPAQISIKSWTSVFAYGSSFVHAIDSNNKLFAWGLGTTGQLGYGDIVSRSSPVQISTGNFSTLGAYGTTPNTLGIQTDGSLWGWGSKTNLLLGDFSSASYTYSWSQVSAGPSHTGAIRSDGRLYTWGYNRYGQLGNNSTVNTSSPTLITTTIVPGAPSEFWNRVAVNDLRTVAVRNDGTLWTWGFNAGILGISDITNRSKPIQIGNSITTEVSNSNIYSTYFNGTSDFLGLPSNITYTGDFTIECWFFPTVPTITNYVGLFGGDSNNFVPMYAVTGNRLECGIFGSNAIVTSTGTFNLNQWNHAALVRSGSTIRFYINGVQDSATATDSSTFTHAGPVIGGLTANRWTGYISNARIVNGQALYTNTFTPSTAPLTTTSQGATASNVSLLTLQNITFVDNSLNLLTLTVNGDPSPGQLVTPFSSYIISATRSWTGISAGLSHTVAVNNLGRMYSWGDNTYQQLGYSTSSVASYSVLFDGNPQYMRIDGASGATTAFTFGTNDFTVEAWVYLNFYPSPNSGFLAGNATTANGFGFGIYRPLQQGKLYMTTSTTEYISTGSTIPLKTWVHVAWTRQSNTVRMFINGVLDYNAGTISTNITETGGNLGGNAGGNSFHPGWVSNLRVVNNQALYTSAFTPSTSQLTKTTVGSTGAGAAVSLTGTVTLLTFQSSAIVDNSNSNNLLVLLNWSGPTTGQIVNPFQQPGVPVQITVPSVSWSQVSSYSNHNLAIDTNNKLYSWGDNTLGQAGQSTNPLQWTSVNNYYTTQMIRNDGIVYVMGLNNGGQLGDATTVNKSSPVQLSGGGSWSQIVSGYDGTNNGYSIGIKTDGTLYAWGLNSSGILGDNTLATTATRSSPVQVGTSNWISVSTMNNSAIAIRSDYTMWAWGKNDQGQLGQGDTTSRSSPVQIGTSSWTQVSVGVSSAMAIRLDGTLYTWGRNTNGQLGDSSTINRSSPVQVGIGNSYIQLSGSSSSKYAIRNDYTLWSWGFNTNGELGLLDAVARSSPVQINTAYYYDLVSSGADHAIAKRRDGTIWSWGLNTWGQLGDNTVVAKSSPVAVGTSSWISVSAGNKNTFGITVAGVNGLQNLYAWGLNSSGEFGLGDTQNRSSPVQLGSGLQLQFISSPTQIGTSSWTTISAGLSNSMAIRSDYKLYTWGDNSQLQSGYITPTTILSTSNKTNNDAQSYIRSTDNALIIWGVNDAGQLGLNDTANRSTPVQLGVGFGNSRFAKIARAKVASAGYTLGIKTDGTLWSWGSGVGGVLGSTTTTNRSSPGVVSTLTNWSDVAAGPSHALAIKTDGSLWGWGLNTSGQAGVLSWAKVSSGSSHTLAIRSDGALYGWGSNTVGQVGDISIVTRSSPVQLGSGSFIQVVAGINISAAIRGDYTLWSWGNNASGALGLGDTANRSSPVQVGLSSWSQISTRDYMAGITYDNRLFTWGSNAGYQLGNGTTNPRSSPVQVGSSSYTSVSAGGSYMAAIRIDSGLFIWGTNTTGQLGLNDVALRSQPTQIGSSSWSVVSASNNAHTLALTTDNKLYAWGNNFFSQLGLNDTVNRSSPVQVGSSSWTNVYAGTNYSIALRTDNTVFAWGDNTRGNLGVYNLLSWTIIGNGIGIHSDYTLWNWGDNSVGQLGISSTQYRSSPVQIGTTSWTYTYSTTSNAYAIKSDGSMWAWGRNYFGQLGLSDTTDRSSPVQIGTDTNWSTVVASATGHALAIKTTGTLWAWGYNQYNELGQNQLVQTNRSAPVQVGSATTWTKVSAGNNYSLGISAFGLWAWGRNEYGQTGNPSNIPLSWTTVAGGDSYSVAIRSDGKLFSWGKNDKGQLGLGHTVSKSAPTQIAVSTNYNLYSTQFTADTGTFLNLPYNAAFGAGTSDFTLEVWIYTTVIGNDRMIIDGGNGAGGRATTSHSLYLSATGTIIYLPGGTAVINAGLIVANTWTHIAVVRISGSTKLYINGIQTGNTYTDAINYGIQQPYIGRNSDSSVNPWTGYITNLRFVKGTGLYTTTFTPPTSILTNITNTIYLVCQNDTFIDNGTANSGVGFTLTPTGTGITTSTLTPFQTTVYNYSWTQVSATLSHTVAIRSDGTLWAWGANDSGQLGQGDIVPRSAPLQVGSSSWTNVFAGPNATYAVRTDGGLFTAGDNTYGILGQGDTVSRSSLVQLGTSSWTSISSSLTGHTLGITNTGALYGWGYNQYNELGLNESNPLMRSSPVQVGTSSWTKVSAGNNFSLAISSNNLLWAWGRNEFGQVPPATGTVLTALSWTTVAGGDSYSVAIRSDGKLFSWGLNNKGQLGLGHTVNKSAPTQIAVSTNYNLYSTQFNGTTDVLTFGANNANLALPGDFTFEFWFYTTIAIPAGEIDFFEAQTTGAFRILKRSTSSGLSYDFYGGTAYLIVADANIPINYWNHVAVSRTSGTLSAYFNGVRTILQTDNTVGVTPTVNYSVGGRTSAINLFTGYISNVRLIKGTGIYSGTGISIPSSPLTAVTNTQLLMCQNNTYIDNAASIAITPIGTGITTSTLTPFQTTVYNYSFTQVSATLSHVLAIRTDGALFSWGDNTSGQLGQSNTTTRSAPIQIGSSSWTQVAAGSNNSFAIRTDGALFAWGDNTNGILGQSDTITRSSPIQIGSSSWTSVSATQHAIGITTANTMFAWGLNTTGQLGDTTTASKSSTVQVQAGFPSSLLVYNSATVVDNSGNSVTMTATGSPTVGSTIIPFSSTNSVNFPTNTYYTTGSLPALGTQYTFEFWAYVTAVPAGNWYWQFTGGSVPMFYFVGNGSAITSIGKINNGGGGAFLGGVTLALNTWAHIAYTRNSANLMTIWLNGSSIATSSDSSSYTGGAALIGYPAGGNGGTGAGYMSNYRFINNSCLYTNTFTPSTTTLTATALLSSLTYTRASAGTSHSVAIRNDSGLYTWGSGVDGRLGNGLTTNRSFAVQIGASNWTQINAGSSWTLGVLSTGGLYSWGAGVNGELGSGATASRSSPVQVGALTTWGVLSGKTHALSITTAGALFTWGTNTAGQLGNNSTTVLSSPVGVASLSGFVFNSQSSPTQIGASNWTQIQAGTLWSAAILTNGALFTWGFGVNGELASGATTARSSPVQVGALTTWGKLAGTTHVLGTLTTGTSTLVAWGTGNIGQLGNNTVTSVSSPVAVSGLLTGLVLDNLSSPTQIGASSWTQLSAGDAHGMALRIDSGLFTWGKADYGQLGSGNSTHRSSPVQIGAGTWSVISAGNLTSAAITTLGSLQTWGRNNIGQLGSATTTDRNSPAAVGTSSWTSVSASKDGMFAVTILNQLFAWGNNNIGQLGVGDTAYRSSPVQIGSNIQTLFSNPTQISASVLPNTNSVYFNGTNDYLALASNAVLSFGTGIFTIECWFYGTTVTVLQSIYDTRSPTDTQDRGYGIYTTVASHLHFGTANVDYISGTTTLLANQWYHVAVVRESTTVIKMYLNGLQEGSTYTASVTQNFNLLNTPRIGNGANGFFNGYISNLRAVSGQALYTGTFTPSKTALTNNTVGSTGSGAAGSLSGTVVLLTCQSTTFVDNSTNNFALQVAGMPLLIGASYTQVSAGESNTVLINTTGVLFNTGDATTGQMGDSTTVNKSFLQVIANPTLYDNRSSPAQIGTGSWSQIAVGLNYSVALASNGTLYTWGDNTTGYLGDGTTLTRRSMTQIGTSSYTSISSGGSHTVALKLDKTLYAWGLNNAGQLGDNSVVSRSSPVQVNTGLATSWNFISAGANHTGALDATYNLPYGWGLNSSGQLGDSTVVSRSAPVQVNTASLQNYSYQFNGSNQYLTSAASASNQLTSNFTIEFWFYAIALNGGSGSGLVAINDAVGPNSSTGLSIFLDTGGILTYFVNGNGGGVAGPTIVISTWYHVALVRSGSTNTLYLNGVSRATSSTTPAWSATPSIGIGRVYNDNGSFVHNGYISNVRIVKGTALYTSGFYPSTGSLTTASQGATANQVLLLTAQSATIVDNSINLTTFTNTGTVTSSTSNPFGPYYSGNFNGSNYLSVTNNSSIDLATGAPDWTIECWFYTTTSGTQRAIIQKDGISGSRQSQYNISISTGNQINLTLSTAVNAGGNQNFVGGSISASTWYHVAAVRSGSNITVFLNGAIIAGPTALSTTLGNNTGDLTIGMNTGPADFFTGYISNLRIVKGTAVYTGSFTPPTNILRTAQSAMTNMVALTGTETILLTLQNATVIDNSASPLTITNNNSVVMTTPFAPFSASGVIVYTAWDSIQAGVTSTMGISNNTLYTWGAGTNGQLGNNTVTGISAPSTTGIGSIWSVAEKLFSSPVQVGTAYSWSLVSAGAGHTVATATDYSLWAWGQNTAGQTGDSTTVGKSSPTQIAGNTSSYTFITAGVSDTFAIRTTTNLLFAWGLNTAGQLGLNDTANRSSPVQVFAGTMTSPLIPIRLNTVSGSSYTVVQAGSAASVIDSLGRLFTWGTNTNGQLGDNTTTNRSSPVQLGGLTGFTYSFSPIQVGSSSYSQVSAGYSHTLAIGITGSLYAWGKTPANGATVTRSSPVQIGSNSWLFVSAGIDASQAIDSTRTLYAWGLNTNYQLGSASFLLNQSVTNPVAIGTLAINTASHTNSVGSGNGGFIKNI